MAGGRTAGPSSLLPAGGGPFWVRCKQNQTVSHLAAMHRLREFRGKKGGLGWKRGKREKRVGEKREGREGIINTVHLEHVAQIRSLHLRVPALSHSEQTTFR